MSLVKAAVKLECAANLSSVNPRTGSLRKSIERPSGADVLAGGEGMTNPQRTAFIDSGLTWPLQLLEIFCPPSCRSGVS